MTRLFTAGSKSFGTPLKSLFAPAERGQHRWMNNDWHIPCTDSLVDLTALVPKDIADLLPEFLRNRRADIARVRAASEEDNWARVQQVAENLYAVGNPYGFRQITTFGRLMRKACAERNKLELTRLVNAYSEYLARVIVVTVDEPVFRPALTPESRRLLVPEGDSLEELS